MKLTMRRLEAIVKALKTAVDAGAIVRPLKLKDFINAHAWAQEELERRRAEK